ncbi:MAG: hypothetical protein ABI830_11975 [Pseudolabrys sp.]
MTAAIVAIVAFEEAATKMINGTPTLFTAIENLVYPKGVNSKFVFVPQGATIKTISVLVSNTGVKPGSVRSGALLLGSTQMVLHIDGGQPNEPRVVEPGKTELFKFVAHTYNIEHVDMPDTCRLSIFSVDYHNVRSETEMPLDCADTRPFVSAHEGDAPK